MGWLGELIGKFLAALGLSWFSKAKAESKEQAEQKAQVQAQEQAVKASRDAGTIEGLTRGEAAVLEAKTEAIADPHRQARTIEEQNAHLKATRRTE